jgi:regulator of RNase E activity RraB
MSQQTNQIVFDNWTGYGASSEDMPLIVSFDVEAAQEDMTDTLTHCARVLIPIHKANADGAPESPETERLYELEDELCAWLSKESVVCRLVARLTHKGTRELVFQLDDWETFRPIVGVWMIAHKDEYEIDVSEHEGWDFFDDCIRPTPEIWLAIEDERVICNLLEAGSNPTKFHALQFRFNGDEDKLKELAKTVAERGYSQESSGEKEQIVMVKRMKLDAGAIMAESLKHASEAESLGVEYDGWDAAVVK